ncbi:MAG: hypothetical protein E7604_10305 [Ruminococcaceae bacterium]|nr:hypothetical protein [Oscillospiraceae bacterium]
MKKTSTPTRTEDTRRWYEPFVPPGMNVEGELIFFLIAMLAAMCYATGFFARLFAQMDLLYQYSYGERTLIPGAVMAPFYEVFNQAWTGYFIVLLCMLGWGIYHDLYYKQDTKSIYTMRRLPDRVSFLRYTWTLTLCEVLVCVLFAILCLSMSYGFYCLMTPDGCLPDGQWTLFWDNLFYRK